MGSTRLEIWPTIDGNSHDRPILQTEEKQVLPITAPYWVTATVDRDLSLFPRLREAVHVNLGLFGLVGGVRKPQAARRELAASRLYSVVSWESLKSIP